MADEGKDKKHELLDILIKAGITHFEARVKYCDGKCVLIEELAPSSELKIRV
jgi:hypothetical protein